MELADTLYSNSPDEVSVQADDSAPCPPAIDRPGSVPYSASQGQNNTVPDPTAFGQNLRLAMACMDGAERLRTIKASKETVETTGHNLLGIDEIIPPPQRSNQALSTQLQSLCAEVDTHRAELVELLVQFDEQNGWVAVGARNCAEWANARLGIAKVSAYTYLKVGRELRKLPVIRVLFRGGELSWSKVRLLVAVADADNERQLAHASIDATVADVDRICKGFRWKKAEQTVDPTDDRTAEDIAADLQFRNRSVAWRELPDGCTSIQITLPPEEAQAVLKSLEHCENDL